MRRRKIARLLLCGRFVTCVFSAGLGNPASGCRAGLLQNGLVRFILILRGFYETFFNLFLFNGGIVAVGHRGLVRFRAARSGTGPGNAASSGTGPAARACPRTGAAGTGAA
jgi:hypothetical protein